MADRFLVVPAVYVVFRRGSTYDEVLLQLRQNTGFMDGHWALAAAGHVEAGESVFEAACREVAEELGTSTQPRHLTPLCVLHRTEDTGLPIDERVDFFFECTRWAGMPRVMEPDKTADLRWFDLGGLPEPVVPHERFVLQQLAAGAVAPVAAWGFGP